MANAIVWNGIVLGTPVEQLQERFANPTYVVTAEDDPNFVVRRYDLSAAGDAFFLVISRNGRVVSIGARTKTFLPEIVQSIAEDPSGVRLGDTMESVKNRHSHFASETLEDGRIRVTGRYANPAVSLIYDFVDSRAVSFEWWIVSAY